MGFAWIRPFSFRNLEDRLIDCDAPQVFLVGDNGQGKTNFVEAAHVLCYGASFRTRVDGRLVRHGEREAAVEGLLRVQGGVEVEIKVRLGGEKQIFVNGKPLRDRAELLAHIPCIVFSHDDFDFVVGPPERRRWFLNQTLSLVDPFYLAALRSYRRVLAARNLLVKQRSVELLDYYDEQLATHGIDVQSRRARAFGGFGAVFSELFARVSGLGTPVRLEYVPSWRAADGRAAVAATIRGRRDLDLRFGVTTAGPHRDSYEFVSADRQFDHQASTGQLRLCSLTLRVAQAHYFLERTGKKPILLLDDVILELDAARKQAFIANLPEREQAFFTFLGHEDYAPYREGKSLSYRVTEGRIEPCGA